MWARKSDRSSYFLDPNTLIAKEKSCFSEILSNKEVYLHM